jgi:hypothetical protein
MCLCSCRVPTASSNGGGVYVGFEGGIASNLTIVASNVSMLNNVVYNGKLPCYVC